MREMFCMRKLRHSSLPFSLHRYYNHQPVAILCGCTAWVCVLPSQESRRQFFSWHGSGKLVTNFNINNRCKETICYNPGESYLFTNGMTSFDIVTQKTVNSALHSLKKSDYTISLKYHAPSTIWLIMPQALNTKLYSVIPSSNKADPFKRLQCKSECQAERS